MPRPTEAMMQQDSADAWARWAANAPLDLLDHFSGELVHGPVGPHHHHHVHLEIDREDQDVAVHLHFAHDQTEDD